MDADSEELSLALNLFLRSQTTEGKPSVDVANLCLNLYRHSANDDVRSAAERLGNLLVSASPVVPGESVDGTGHTIE